MKKLLVVLAVLTLIASFSFAQSLTGVGPKAQLNLTTIGGDNTSDAKMVAKFGIGGFVVVNLIPELDLQGELLYDQKGVGSKASSDAGITLSYIDVNVLAKYLIPMEGDIKPTVFAGPSMGTLLSAKADPGGHDIKAQTESLDYGLIFGVGASMNVGDGSILVDVRYDLGLANINKHGAAKNTNQVIAISVGYAFRP